MDNNIKIPTHIAYIIDGNGRWAKQKNMPRSYGHKVGMSNLKKILKETFALGIKYVSVYAFSTENWNRPKEEVAFLMSLFKKYLKKDLVKDFENIKVNIMGDISKFDEELQQAILNLIEKTKNNTENILNLGINYGGKDEVVMAVNKLIKEGKKVITKEDISNNLYTSGQPDPDFIIRTSGEKRISNFMIWQSAYSEWYFPEVFWPGFHKKHLLIALNDYSTRKRRFGKIEEGVNCEN